MGYIPIAGNFRVLVMERAPPQKMVAEEKTYYLMFLTAVGLLKESITPLLSVVCRHSCRAMTPAAEL
jgi:hypothetical protein